MNIGGRRMTNGDIALGIGLIVAVISVFLPWYSASFNCNGIPGCAGFNTSASVGGLSYWSGWLFFLAALVGLALWILRSFVPTVSIPALPQTDAVIYLIIGIFMIVMAVLWFLLGSGASVSGPGYSAGPSFGLFIGLIAAIAVTAGGFLKRADPQPATRPLGTGTGTGYGGYGGTGAPPPPPPSA
jgi:hypothetical protein